MPLRSFRDQLGEEVTIQFPPRRIISLVPSQTELLADLGLYNSVVGITKFCVHPKSWLSSKTIIGGTKNFSFHLIDELQPDLIIGNKEENYKEGIENLKIKHPVWVSDITSLQDAFQMVHSVGLITDKLIQAEQLISSVKNAFNTLPAFKPYRVLYLIWRKPWMAVGIHTFINQMLIKLGLVNVIVASRYPEISLDEIQSLHPEYIFLSSEPYPFQEKHIPEIHAMFPGSRVVLVDGEMFSWYGSRLRFAPDYFKTLNFLRS